MTERDETRLTHIMSDAARLLLFAIGVWIGVIVLDILLWGG